MGFVPHALEVSKQESTPNDPPLTEITDTFQTLTFVTETATSLKYSRHGIAKTIAYERPSLEPLLTLVSMRASFEITIPASAEVRWNRQDSSHLPLFVLLKHVQKCIFPSLLRRRLAIGFRYLPAICRFTWYYFSKVQGLTTRIQPNKPIFITQFTFYSYHVHSTLVFRSLRNAIVFLFSHQCFAPSI